ncbi:MAG: rhomboid-like protein [Actinoallomurus sp.]
MPVILRRFPLPVVFIVALCAVSSVYVYGLGLADQRSFVAWTATNLINLRSDPLGTLIASAFVSETAPWIWVGFAVVGLFPLVHRFGNLRALLLVTTAHVVGTLLSEGLLALRIASGAAPASLRALDDVGPSYVIAAALIAAIVYGAEPAVRTASGGHWLFDRIASRWWRLGAAIGLALLAPNLFDGLGHLDVAAVGHSVALVTGAGVGLILARLEPRGVRRAITATSGSSMTSPKTTSRPTA